MAQRGNRTEYLESLATAFPGRDSKGYVIGYYVYGGYGAAQKREAGPFATVAEAQFWADRVLDGQVVCGHVFTTKGKIVRDVHDTAINGR